jgi:hypothetical protein
MRFIAWFVALLFSFAFYFWALSGNLEGLVHPFIVYALVMVPLFSLVGLVTAAYQDAGMIQDASDSIRNRKRR